MRHLVLAIRRPTQSLIKHADPLPTAPSHRLALANLAKSADMPINRRQIRSLNYAACGIWIEFMRAIKQHDHRALSLRLATLCVTIAIVANAARADICVSCTGPEASYACAIEGTNIRSDDAGMRVYCLQSIAKSRGHASCTVSRSAQPPCAGQREVIASPSDTAPNTAPAARAEPIAQPAGQPNANLSPPNTPAEPSDDIPNGLAAKPSLGQPKTVSDMIKSQDATPKPAPDPRQAEAGDAENTNGTMLDGAGRAVTDAAKKTWTCVTSLFGDC